MSELVIDQPRPVIRRAGRYPGAVVAGTIGRKAARSAAVWGTIFAAYSIGQILAYTSAYPTQADRDALTKAFATNLGLNALLGQARGINTVAGYASWRLLGILSILGAIWGLLTATRLLRGDEEAGRYELLLTGPTTRYRAALQAVTGLGVGLAVLFGLTAVGTVITGRASSVGFTVGQSLYLAVTLVASAAVFLAVGALTSQLADTRRRAAGLAAAIFGVCFTLRMVGDSDHRLHWLVWLSPFGWIEQSRPLTDPRPLALLPVAVLVLGSAALAVRLAANRDVGAASIRRSGTAAPRLALLGGPTGLAVRLMRPVAVGWLLGIAAFALLLGTVAESSAKDVGGDASVQDAVGRLGGQGSPVAAYLGLTLLILAFMVALVAAGQIGAIRSEEADGYLEHLVVRPVSRTAWFAVRLLLSAGLLLVAGLVAGVATWAGAATQHGAVGFGPLLAAGLNVVAPSLFLLGLGALVFGFWPRLTATVVYAYLAWSFLIEFVGGVVRANHWLLDTSVFFHLVPAPAASPNWASAAVLAGLGVAGAILGGLRFSRRDVLGA